MNPALESIVTDPLTYEAGGSSAVGQLLAFGMVGGSGAVAFVLLSTLTVSVGSGMPHWIMSTLCYAVLIGPVYLLHRRFSFRSEAPHRHALPRYVSVQVGALVLASLFSYVAYHVMALPTFWASVMVTGLTSGVSFMVLKFWAFTHPVPAPVGAAANAAVSPAG